MKDIDRVNIQDGILFEIFFDKVEKYGFEKPSFWGGDIIISPPGTDRVKIPGYHDLISKNRSNSNYGGVGLYIKSKYSFSLIDSLNNLVLKKLELLAVKVELGKKYVYVISTSRPPNSSLNDTMEDLDKIFDKIGNHSTIFSGDLFE